MADSSPDPGVGDPGGADDERATSAAPPPSAAATTVDEPRVPDTMEPEVGVKKPVYSICAPRSTTGASDGGPAAGTSNGGSGSGSKGKSRTTTTTTAKKKKKQQQQELGDIK